MQNNPQTNQNDPILDQKQVEKDENERAKNPAELVRLALKSGETPSKRHLERGLCEVFGLSRRQSKSFIAKGFSALGDPDGADEIADALARITQALRK